MIDEKVSWRDTEPGIGGNEAQLHAACTIGVGEALGPIIRHLDKDRQIELASKIIAAGPHIREEIVDGMVDYMSDFKENLKRKIYDAVIFDFKEEEDRDHIVDTILDATMRGNLSAEQLNRFAGIRRANFHADRSYRDSIEESNDFRLQNIQAHKKEQSYKHVTSDTRYGIAITSDTLKYSADLSERLNKFKKASKLVHRDAKTLRADLLAAREPRGRYERGL